MLPVASAQTPSLNEISGLACSPRSPWNQPWPVWWCRWWNSKTKKMVNNKKTKTKIPQMANSFQYCVKPRLRSAAPLQRVFRQEKMHICPTSQQKSYIEEELFE